ncbi:hypothetical protein [Isoptericola hypogeus]
MLERAAFDVVPLGAVRQRDGESDPEYVARMSAALGEARCTHAWLCVPPGRHVPLQVEAAARRGIHVIGEKPWPYDPADLGAVAAGHHGVAPRVLVCFEYVLLSGVQAWRESQGGGAGLTFHGVFSVAAPDRLGIPALWNMGSHLAAIREWAVPESSVGSLRARYDAEPERRVWLEDASGTRVSEVDFLSSAEPILERFAAGATEGRGPVTELDPGFAARVSRVVAALEPWPGGADR